MKTTIPFNKTVKYVLTIPFLLFAIHVFGQEKTCLDFMVGTFVYSDPDYADLVTVRNDSLQTDSYPAMGWETTCRVSWLTECKYEIEYIRVNNPMMEGLIGIKYVIEIINIDQNKILCKTESEGIVVEKEMILTATDH